MSHPAGAVACSMLSNTARVNGPCRIVFDIMFHRVDNWY